MTEPAPGHQSHTSVELKEGGGVKVGRLGHGKRLKVKKNIGEQKEEEGIRLRGNKKKEKNRTFKGREQMFQIKTKV